MFYSRHGGPSHRSEGNCFASHHLLAFHSLADRDATGYRQRRAADADGDLDSVVASSFRYCTDRSIRRALSIVAFLLFRTNFVIDQHIQLNHGYIDKSGRVVFNPRVNSVARFSEGLAAVRTDKGWGYVNGNGDTVVPCQFTYAKPFSEGLAEVGVGEGSDTRGGFIDHSGKLVIRPQFQLIGPFKGGLSEVSAKKDDDWRSGFINSKGQLVVPITFKDVHHFSEGFAPVIVEETPQGNYLWRYIDGAAGYAFDQKFEEARSFSEGLAFVRTTAHQSGFIDRTGQDEWCSDLSSTTRSVTSRKECASCAMTENADLSIGRVAR